MTMTMIFISEQQIFTRFLIHMNKGNKGKQEVKKNIFYQQTIKNTSHVLIFAQC